jgi:hypothetical protein
MSPRLWSCPWEWKGIRNTDMAASPAAINEYLQHFLFLGAFMVIVAVIFATGE